MRALDDKVSKVNHDIIAKKKNANYQLFVHLKQIYYAQRCKLTGIIFDKSKNYTNFAL